MFRLPIQCAVITAPRPVQQNNSMGALDLEPMAQVVLYNDEVNTFDHIVKCLMDVFSHGEQMAEKLTLDAHENGRTIAEVESKSEAVFHKEQLTSYGITAEVEVI